MPTNEMDASPEASEHKAEKVMTSPPNHMGDDSSLRRKTAAHPALLPCPFCGDTKTLKPGASYHAVRIYCRCGATGPSIFASYDEDVEDIDPAACVAAWGAWNRRAPQDEAGAKGNPGATNNPADLGAEGEGK